MDQNFWAKRVSPTRSREWPPLNGSPLNWPDLLRFSSIEHNTANFPFRSSCRSPFRFRSRFSPHQIWREKNRMIFSKVTFAHQPTCWRAHVPTSFHLQWMHEVLSFCFWWIESVCWAFSACYLSKIVWLNTAVRFKIFKFKFLNRRQDS